MKRNINLWTLWGFAVVSMCGTLLHFLYDLHPSPLTAAISGVNESTWEHMKLMFFPMLIFALFQRRFFPDREDFWCIKLRSTLLGLAMIPVIFYTYNGVIGKSPDWINIAIFFISAAIAYTREAYLMHSNTVKCPHPRLALAILCIIGISFVIFTFAPPQISIFKDPVTDIFGIPNTPKFQ